MSRVVTNRPRRRILIAAGSAWTLGSGYALMPRTARSQVQPRTFDAVTLEKAPELQIGDTWTYSVTDRMAPADDYSETRTVSGRFTNGYGVDVTDSKGRKRRGVVSFDLNDLVRFQADGPIIEFKHFQWPMYAGRKWSYEYDSPGRVDGMTDVARNERRITTEAVEDVGVPAGRFAAVRVLVIGSYQVRYQGGTGAGTIEERHWYSPVTRSYLKSEITHRNNFANIMYLIRRELTAYKLASGGRTIG